jgi:hypothetical protein
LDIYFDFTCPYSRRTARWWRELGEPGRWRPFLLREAHRNDDGPPEWDRDDALQHVSVLALALHEAVQATGADVDAYRHQAIDLFESGPVDAHTLRQLAARVTGRDLDEETTRAGLAGVAQAHGVALSLGVFGTPTFVGSTGAAYVKLDQQPNTARARAVHQAVVAVLDDTPEVAEIKRPG